MNEHFIRLTHIDMVLFNKEEITFGDFKQGISLQIPIKEIKRVGLLSLLVKLKAQKAGETKNVKSKRNSRKV
jgi:hypothetical protein